jgi:glycosyltransferase involved in cell wall biosynthesis
VTATRPVDRAPALLRALDQRVTAAATALGVDGPADASGPGSTSAVLLPLLAAAARLSSGTESAWLLLTAVHAAMPTADEVHALRRALELDDDEVVVAGLLAAAVARPSHGDLELEMDVVVDGVVVNVDFCARHDIHTGIHRVVRETLPRWAARHTLVATANVDAYTALRTLAPREHQRVFEYGSTQGVEREAEQAYRARLVVPWRGVLVIPEIPDPAFGPSLAALAELSGNALCVIGYDMIPVVSADLRPAVDAVRFGRYLTVVKHAARVAGISESATTEFAGYAHAVTAQGLPGPDVTEVPLPGDVPPDDAEAPVTGGRRQVLCVGSHEPHKNHDTVLHAAERLWREGLDFELVLIGGPGWQSEAFQQRLATVQAAGRPVVVRGRVDDAALWRAFREAEFSVFVSLHEGFGLPVVESLACGTPVVTTAYGSMGEIAADGGCLVVDPTDDDQVTGAVRDLLTDAGLLERLRREARERPQRTWDDYAAELWDALAPARKVAP